VKNQKKPFTDRNGDRPPAQPRKKPRTIARLWVGLVGTDARKPPSIATGWRVLGGVLA